MSSGSGIDRRRFMQLAGLSGAAVLAGCKQSESGSDTARTLRIGYVSPRTGPLAGFGEADDFILGGVRKALEGGLAIGGSTYPVEIVTKDSQSDPNRAAAVAGDLINADKVDLMLVASTPETTNPVADQCEANGVPCISSVAPWQPWFFGRKGDPDKPFQWTYHFFWGLEDIIAVFTDMWTQVDNNKVVAALWPNDGDGNAWGDKKLGFPPALTKEGYRIVDPGRYQNGTEDFSSQISRFKAANAEIVTGVPIPPDWTTFWKQASQQGFRPKIASVGKALLFPASVEALGDIGDGMSTEVWWSPQHPFKSSLTGATAAQVAEEYQTQTNKQWTQPIGFVHALFEVAAAALKGSGNVDDRQALANAIKAVNLDTVVGKISWSGGPVPNVAKTPLVGGQWRKGTGKYPFDLMIVSNKDHPEIPKAGTIQPIPYS